jgi:tight adherence protein C
MIGFGPLALVFAGLAALIAGFVVHGAIVERHQVGRTLKAMSAYQASAPELRDHELAKSFTARVLLPALMSLGRFALRILPTSATERLNKLLVQAGNPPGWDAERVLAARLAGGVVGGIGLFVLLGAAGTVGPRALFGAGFGAAVGYWLPERLVRDKANRRQALIRQALPDTLDLLAITVEAGLSFDAALSRIAGRSHGPLADELNRILHEIQLGRTRADALRDLAERSNIPEMKSFVLAMVQADTFGVSVGRTLKVQAHEMRLKRRQRAEEAAQKIPVKITFPLIACIMPTLFIMLLGPAAINISRSLFGQ